MLRLLEHPCARRLVVLLGVALALPTLGAGFFADDWFMLAALRRRWPHAPPWWDLYEFVTPSDDGVRADVAQGLLPWWTPPSLRLHLVRPLSAGRWSGWPISHSSNEGILAEWRSAAMRRQMDVIRPRQAG